MRKPAKFPAFLAVAAFGVASTAQAQWAVVDVGAIAQLMQQVRLFEQQLQVANRQLQSAQQSVQQMSGDRGMSRLLANSSWNSLPPSWDQLSRLAGGSSGSYSALSQQVQAETAANAVLTPSRMAELPDSQRTQIDAERRWISADAVVAQTALANASERFASLQTLLAALSRASDAKATLDLQARIAVELAMLENEQIKLHALGRALDAQSAVLRQQSIEQGIAAQGQFATRFRPAP